jgi:hypothetical protein
MPIITCFNHDSGIAPYDGVVAATSNSRTLTQEQAKKDKRYSEASRQCERVAELMQAIAPIRVDIRRYNKNPDISFALVDINMKLVSSKHCMMSFLFAYIVVNFLTCDYVEHDGARTSRSRRSGQSDSYVSRCTWVVISNVAAKSACDGKSFECA